MLSSRQDFDAHSKKTSRKSTKFLKWLLLYYPIRYGICAFFLAYVLLMNVQLIKSTEGQILACLLQTFHLPTFYSNGYLLVGSIYSPIKLTLTVYSQILFLIFFPTVAITSRANFKIRAKLLSFGALCFFGFILTEFLIILVMVVPGISANLRAANTSFIQLSTFLDVICGGLIIELSLFYIITLPKSTKIKPVIKRSYAKEYGYFMIQILLSLVLIYFMFELQLFIDSPVTTAIVLHLNMTSVFVFSYFMSYLIYPVRIPRWMKIPNQQNLRISFLISAYNEEKLIRRCIESIDKAASRYGSEKIEIIVVNDGSTDNTAKVVTDAFLSLKRCKGKLFSVRNAGKGSALKYGLEQTSGDIIFRIDGDSTIDENAIQPTMNHFKDPQVGVVGGMILTLDVVTRWQKVLELVISYFNYVIRRAQDLTDSVQVESGAYSVFRKEALIKAGGWVDNQLGEDGEITNRLGRLGYRTEFEPNSLAFSDAPQNLVGIINQRARWSIAFYHARARNFNLIKEGRGPRSIVFLTNIITYGIAMAHSMVWPYLAASIITGTINIYNMQSLFAIPLKFAVVQVVFFAIEISLFAYYLNKNKRLRYLKYFPARWIISFILAMGTRPQVMEIMLSWSSKWPKYDKDSFQDLRHMVKTKIDPVL